LEALFSSWLSPGGKSHFSWLLWLAIEPFSDLDLKLLFCNITIIEKTIALIFCIFLAAFPIQ
jgi:hypothetical protein